MIKDRGKVGACNCSTHSELAGKQENSKEGRKGTLFPTSKIQA